MTFTHVSQGGCEPSVLTGFQMQGPRIPEEPTPPQPRRPNEPVEPEPIDPDPYPKYEDVPPAEPVDKSMN